MLFEQGRKSREDFINDEVGSTFDEFAASGFEIDRTGLSAQDDTGRLRAGAGHRDSEAAGSGEFAASRDGDDDRQAHQLVERIRRDNQNEPPAALFMANNRVQIDVPNIASPQGTISSPTAGVSTHSRSAAVSGASGSH